jgi:hypothetical protein
MKEVGGLVIKPIALPNNARLRARDRGARILFNPKPLAV